MTKDATIREIHHRVKNNLQTVAALLRLQARRVPDAGAKVALQEAERRVETIALVHETLGRGFDETVDFDEVALRGLRAVVEVATRGAPGRVDADGILRPAEGRGRHGVGDDRLRAHPERRGARARDRDGRIDITAKRVWVSPGQEELTVVIVDDGVGLPAGFRPGLAGLGTRIVTSLVQDLGGRIRWENAPGQGTRVEFIARLRPMSR